MVITAHNGSDAVSVFRNTATSGSIGSGSFATKVDFTTGTGTGPTWSASKSVGQLISDTVNQFNTLS